MPALPPVVSAKPRIAYDNLLITGGGTITTTSDQTDYEYQNAYDWKPFTFWKPAAVGSQKITAVFTTPKTANYFAFYNQNIYSNGGTIALEWSDDGVTWTPAATVTPQDNKPVYVTFGDISALRWRVNMTSTPVSELAVVAFGQDMELERGVWIGFTPPFLGRKTKTTTMVSDNGTFIGRSVIKRGCASRLELDHLSALWVRQIWFPFMLHAELYPFFLSWCPNKHASEAAFCWVENADGDIGEPSYTHKTMMDASIRFSCNVE